MAPSSRRRRAAPFRRATGEAEGRASKTGLKKISAARTDALKMELRLIWGALGRSGDGPARGLRLPVHPLILWSGRAPPDLAIGVAGARVGQSGGQTRHPGLEEGGELTLAWRRVIGAGFALPRDADRRSAFQAVPARFLPQPRAVSRASRRAVPGGAPFPACRRRDQFGATALQAPRGGPRRRSRRPPRHPRPG